MTYNRAIENRDIARIDKLNKLTNPETFWDDVRKILGNKVHSDHVLSRWQCLAEYRYNEITA